MAFQHKPMRQDERESKGKFYTEGLVNFEVLSIDEAISKTSGSNMIVINLFIWDRLDKEGTIKDYITESMNWRTEDFLTSIGMQADCDNQNFDRFKYCGKTGKGKIKYKKDDDGKWKHQFYYVMPDVKVEEAQSEGEPFNDDIPMNF